MLNFLNKQPGVKAETKAVKKNGKDYQFDILMLFDDIMFMFALKNKTLSYGVVFIVVQKFQLMMWREKSLSTVDKYMQPHRMILK